LGKDGKKENKFDNEMRVLIVSHSCIVDVNQARFMELSKYSDIEIRLIVPQYFRDDFSSPKTFKRHPEFQAKIYALPSFLNNIPNKSINLHFYPDWNKIIKEFKPDILYIEEEPWSLSAFQFAVVKGRSKFLFFTEQNLFKHYPFPFCKFEEYVYKKSDCAIAVSEDAKNVLLKKGYEKKIFVIPHSINVKMFSKKDTQKLKKKLGLEGFVIGYVGRLVKEKGLDILVKAVKRLNHYPLSLLIVGSGPELHRIQKLANGLKRVYIIENIPHREVSIYLSCMDVLVLPSISMNNWTEQFGRVIIEALACEVPVIGSDCGEIPNLIKKTKGGLIFKEGDVDELSQKLTKFIDSPEKAKRFAKNGKKEVIANYSYEINAKKLLSVYKYVLTT
jgi:glycosyltransferase involved in cell wall biosynthesis